MEPLKTTNGSNKKFKETTPTCDDGFAHQVLVDGLVRACRHAERCCTNLWAHASTVTCHAIAASDAAGEHMYGHTW